MNGVFFWNRRRSHGRFRYGIRFVRLKGWEEKRRRRRYSKTRRCFTRSYNGSPRYSFNRTEFDFERSTRIRKYILWTEFTLRTNADFRANFEKLSIRTPVGPSPAAR